MGIVYPQAGLSRGSDPRYWESNDRFKHPGTTKKRSTSRWRVGLFNGMVFTFYQPIPLHLPLLPQKLTAWTWKSPLWKGDSYSKSSFLWFQPVGFGGVNMFSRHLREGRQTFAPPKTNECPLKSGHFKRKGSSSTIFEGTTLSFEGSNWQNQKDFPFIYTGSTFSTFTLLFYHERKNRGRFPGNLSRYIQGVEKIHNLKLPRKCSDLFPCSFMRILANEKGENEQWPVHPGYVSCLFWGIIFHSYIGIVS